MGTGQLGRLKGASVLLYHGISDTRHGTQREWKYWVGRGQFRSHIDFLRRHDYQVASLADFWRSSTAPERTVVVTFDDGRVSDYEMAFPVLAAVGFMATFFVNTATIGMPGFLNWAQIKEMSRGGMSIESHGHEHVFFSRLSRPELQEQMGRSKKTLEDALGTAVSFIAPPYGESGESLTEMAIDSGYRALCTGRSWPAQVHRKRVHRTVVYGSTTVADLERLADRDPLIFCARTVRAGVLYLPKRLMSVARPSAKQ